MKTEIEVLLRRFYAEGVTPGMALKAMQQAQEELVNEMRTTEFGDIPQDEWPQWLIDGDFLPSGIRQRFAAKLDRELTNTMHQLFDWAVHQWSK